MKNEETLVLYNPQIEPWLRNPQRALSRGGCDFYPSEYEHALDLLKGISPNHGAARFRVNARFLLNCVPGVRDLVVNAIKNDLQSISDYVESRALPRERLSLTIWVVFSLGGGTGSGIFLDVLDIIKGLVSSYFFGGGKSVFPLAIVPNEPTPYNDHIYMANGYAALADLVCKLSTEESKPYDAFFLAGFNDAMSEEIQSSLDDKIVRFITTVHKIPVGGAGQLDWANILQLGQNVAGVLGEDFFFTTFDSVQIYLPIEDIEKYIKLRSEIDGVKEQLEYTDEEDVMIFKQNIGGHVKKLEEYQSDNPRRIALAVGAIVESKTLRTEEEKIQILLSEIIENMSNQVQTAVIHNIEPILGRTGELLRRDLRNLSQEQHENIQSQIENIRKNLIPKSSKLSSKDPNEVVENVNKIVSGALDNALKSLINTIEKYYEDSCDRHIWPFSVRCRGRMHRVINELKGHMNAYKKITRSLNRYLLILNAINIYKQESLIPERERLTNKLNELEYEMRLLYPKIFGETEKDLIKRDSESAFRILLSTEGADKLYEEYKTGGNKALQGFTTGGLLNAIRGGYTKISEEQLYNQISNALLALQTWPISVERTEILNIIERKGVIRRTYVILADDNDRILMNEVMQRYNNIFAGPNVGNSIFYDETLGPRLYISLIVHPIPLHTITDLYYLNLAYKNLPDSKYRHVMRRAKDINLLQRGLTKVAVRNICEEMVSSPSEVKI